MGSRSDRVDVSLVCSVCGARNYKTTRSKRPDAKAVELRKFCKTCAVHTVHVESK